MAARDGFTMVEVLIALVLLAVVLVGMQTATGRFVRIVSDSDRQAAAVQIAEDRVELIRADPEYGELESRYEGLEADVPDYIEFTRETRLLHVRDSTAAGITDYKRVTVTVDGRGLVAPVVRSVTVGRP